MKFGSASATALLAARDALLARPKAGGAAAAAFLTVWLLLRRRAAREVSAVGKVIVVTGCDQGFGNALAKRLGRRGFRVFAGCLTDEGVADIDGAHIEGLTGIRMDVTKARDVDAAVLQMEGEIRAAGGLYALVNNAGISRGYHFEWTPLSDYRAVMEVNYFGALTVTQALLPHLKAAGGRVLNVSSVAGLLAVPCMTAYTASKHALQAWSDGLRAEMAPFGVQVASVNPTFHRTAFVAQFVPHIRSLWARLDAERRAQYGPTALARFEAAFEDVSRSSGDPEHVVSALERLVVQANGRLPNRVRVGLDGPGLLSYLPWHGLYSLILDPMANTPPEHPELARAQYKAAGAGGRAE